MGKIFDALEKAKRESLLINKGLEQQIQYEEQNEEKVPPNDTIVTLPRVLHPKKKKRFLINRKKRFSQYIDFIITEQFRLLKTRIFYSMNGNSPRIILITSALPLEGKSMVAANLAITLAQGFNEHALLVDCDFRKPGIHKLFGLAPEKGLADYLSHNGDIPSILLKTDTPKLTLLPVGEKPLNPLDLLASEKWKFLIKELKSRYNDRYIILDSSPIQLASETRLLISHVDGVIMVVKADKTDRRMVLKFIQEIDKEKLLGVVLNCLSKSISNQASYYYRNY